MKAATVLAVVLSGVAFAAYQPEEFKDLTNLKYKNELPVAEAVMRRDSVEARSASKPYKDNRKLRYNANTKFPMAAVVEDKGEIMRRDASKPYKDNRKLRYNANTKFPMAAVVEDKGAES